jgi:hypothetical protein
MKQVYEFVEAIARFENLQKLTLRVFLEDCGDHGGPGGYDLETACALCSHLPQAKVGLPIISLTFNVCGWNRQLHQARLPPGAFCVLSGS